MNLSCEIVRDLLPLYADDACSDETRRAVEAHLSECEACRSTLVQSNDFSLSVPGETIPGAERAVARGFRRIRRRWLLSVILTAILIPMCILGWNQVSGIGVHFTNLRELAIGWSYMRALESGDYDSAYDQIDLTSMKEDWLDEWFDEDALSHMEADGRRVFAASAEWLESVGGISSVRYVGIVKSGDHYELLYTADVSGEERDFTLCVTDQGVANTSAGGSFLTDPVAHFCMWSEWLWEEYAGCRFDPETGNYVYK